MADTPAGWREYGLRLAALAADPARQKREGFDRMTRGWAIGSAAWREAIVASQRDRPVLEMPFGPERDALREAAWKQVLDSALTRIGQTRETAGTAPKGAAWKLALVEYLRRTTTATHRWIARELHMGKPASVRFYLSQVRRGATPIARLLDP